MSEDIGGLPPLNWPVVVREALRRRKTEGMTQKEHAALSGVSIPTIASFDRGETTLTLAKAFDILRAVGMIEETSTASAQETFVRDAFMRWRSLVDKLPARSPGRFPDGWYRFDYALQGDLKAFSLTQFERILKKAVTRHTGWPVFLMLDRQDVAPKEVEGLIECWLPPEGEGIVRHVLADPAHCDFWRGAPTGRMFSLRGYQEDGAETFPPHTIFDTALPIWRMGEALLHAENLARFMRAEGAELKIRFRALYTGLSGRVLRSWANPVGDLRVEGFGARSDEVLLETEVAASDVSDRLAEHLYPMVAALYERFGVTGLGSNQVRAEVDRLLKSHVG